MPKYSDADALLAQMKDRRFYVGRRSDPVCIIEDAPAADVEPVRHGRWIDENPASFWDPRMRCSVCGHVDLPLAKWRFCPMCGAKMDEESPKGENND